MVENREEEESGGKRGSGEAVAWLTARGWLAKSLKMGLRSGCW